jgi:MFS transporter, ACS family, allantoate permease
VIDQQLILTVLSIAWAVLIGCHAATRNFTGIMIVRFFLGAAEAAAIPGFSLMTGMWYKREEHPLRHGFWFLGTSTGIILAGILSFGIAHIKGGNGPWRVRIRTTCI